MEKIQQRIACKAAIRYNDKLLILREAPTNEDGTNIGKYQLPGGRIEAGEPFMDGLKREIFEETGLNTTIGAPFYVGEWFPNIRGIQNHIVAIFFECEAVSDQVMLSDEHDHHEWIDPREYTNYNLMSPEDKAIDAYLQRQS
jgi:8-oxo-dGTP diphosphatase